MTFLYKAREYSLLKGNMKMLSMWNMLTVYLINEYANKIQYVNDLIFQMWFKSIYKVDWYFSDFNPLCWCL